MEKEEYLRVERTIVVKLEYNPKEKKQIPHLFPYKRMNLYQLHQDPILKSPALAPVWKHPH